jgi:hypothetical protein
MDNIPPTMPSPSPLSRNNFSVTPSNLNTHGKHEISMDLSGQQNQALKADLKTHIWSPTRAQFQVVDTSSHVATCIRDGEVRVNTDVNRAVSHNLEGGLLDRVE